MPTPAHPSDPARPLDIERIRARLAGQPIGHTIEYAPAMPSTMPAGHAWAVRGPTPATAHGVVITTETQTAGRGRRGRTWLAPQNHALLTSVVLASPPLVPHLALLPMLLGLAALEAAAQISPALRDRLGLKWPNDLVFRPTRPDHAPLAKWGGILVESVFQNTPDGAPSPYAVAGIGLNVNQATHDLPPHLPPALPATSLRCQTHHPLDRSELLIALCTRLGERIEHLVTSPTGPDELRATWKNRLVLMGVPIQVYPPAGPSYPAVAQDITPTGQLIVQDANGNRHVLAAEEVSIRPASSPS